MAFVQSVRVDGLNTALIRYGVASGVLGIVSMLLSCPLIFDENRPISWRLGAMAALISAVFGLRVSTEFSLSIVAISLSAAIISVLISSFAAFKLPRGLLGWWTAVLFGVWLSPWADLPAETQRYVLSAAIILMSLVYQGALAGFFVATLLALGLLLPTVTIDLATGSGGLRALLFDDSIQLLLFAVATAVITLLIRQSRTQTNTLERALGTASEGLVRTRTRLGAVDESVQQAREKFLGRAMMQGEVILSDMISESPLEEMTSYVTSFDEVIGRLRKTFAEFQTEGRQRGSIAGPVRFVFFAPAAGYDEKSIISVDIESLVQGVEACLQLALESLPEIGARKREGVIRLSIRYGLRVIEVSIEDNGRGLIARNPEAEVKLMSLKELTRVWGGTFDRVARLGVGSRTSLELSILRERSRSYRATLNHPLPASSPAASATHV